MPPRTRAQAAQANTAFGRLQEQQLESLREIAELKRTLRTLKADRVSKHYPRPRKSQRSRGMHNAGTWCYRNAILQCLIHEPAYLAMLKDVHKRCEAEDPNECVPCTLKYMALMYWQPGPGWHARRIGRRLDNALKATIAPGDHFFGEDLHGNRQSDPFDFMKLLLAKLKGDVDQGTPDSDRVNKTFEVRLKESWRCQFCNKERGIVRSSEPGLDVRVQADTLPACIDRTFIADDVNIACSCRASQRYHDAEKKWPRRERIKKIVDSPELLVLRLLRFQHRENEEGKWVQYKEDKHIEYEEYLDLKDNTVDGKDLVYRLDGVVTHSGESVQGGHFVAWLRTADDNIFKLIDDEHVRRLSSRPRTCNSIRVDPAHADDEGRKCDDGLGLEALLEPFKYGGAYYNHDPYVLVYRKVP